MRLAIIAAYVMPLFVSAQTAPPATDRIQRLPLTAAPVSPTRPTVTVLKRVEPKYTAEARKAKLEGTVLLEFTVDAKGVPQDIQTVSGLGMGLDENAVEALRQWRFGRVLGRRTAHMVFKLPK